jgi:filamentous hemagglutinin
MNAWHDQAFNQLKHIYNAPGEFKKIVDAKTGLTWIEKRLPDGRGIRLNQDYTFKGFVD